MKHQRRFETDSRAEAQELSQISTLISDLDRIVVILGADIETEEERARVRELSDPTYPILARSLRARRDNIAATIDALQKRLQLRQRASTTKPSVADVAA